MKRFAWASSLLVAACGPTSDGADRAGPIEANSAQQPIVRGEPESGIPQVVLLDRDMAGRRRGRCSGTYIAPRLVLTAAHCVVPDTLAIHVYYGNDYAADVGKRYQPVPPGQPSVWAHADSWQTHPDYDPALKFPDVAVVFLDRELPMKPLPVALWRIGKEWVGARALEVGWGANVAKSADITQTEGFGVKRSGWATILGSPTRADYHEDDPHPGVLDPAIRAKLLKMDGTAPNNVNGCAGDSGSPLLVQVGGWRFLAGVASFTGLWCEDYSLFTRTTAVLPFLAGSVLRTGILPVKLDGCVVDQPDGRLAGYFSYTNPNGVALDLPLGPRNRLDLDTEGTRPTRFSPDRILFGAYVSLQPGQRAEWRVDPELAHPTKVALNAHSPRCGEDDLRFLCDALCRVAIPGTAWSGDPSPTPRECFQGCAFELEGIDKTGCGDVTRAYLRCAAQLPPEVPWYWFGDFLPMPDACSAEWNAWFSCQYGSPDAMSAPGPRNQTTKRIR